MRYSLVGGRRAPNPEVKRASRARGSTRTLAAHARPDCGDATVKFTVETCCRTFYKIGRQRLCLVFNPRSLTMARESANYKFEDVTGWCANVRLQCWNLARKPYGYVVGCLVAKSSFAVMVEFRTTHCVY